MKECSHRFKAKKVTPKWNSLWEDFISTTVLLVCTKCNEPKTVSLKGNVKLTDL